MGLPGNFARCLTLLAAALFGGIVQPAAAQERGSAPQAALTIMVFQGVQNLPLIAAQAKGYFARHGLSVDMRIAPNSVEMRDGLAQGRYQLVHGAADNAVAMVELAKADVLMFMGGDNGFNSLILQPELRSFEDIRGRKVVVDAPNTAFALILYKVLQQNGLKRGDYVVNPLGAGPLRIVGMQKDKDNAAVILNLPFSIQAERAGLKNMGLAVRLIGPYLSTVGFTLRSWAPANPDVLVRYIQAYIEGLRWASSPANKAEASQLLAERLKLPLDIATQSYEIATHPVDGFARDAALDVEGLRSVLKLRAEIEGQWGGVPPPPERYLDLSYYRKAVSALGK